MQELLKKLLQLKASSRTKRYFLRDFLSDSSDSKNAAKLCDVVKTLNALRKNIGVSNYIASSAGGDWNVHDYELPVFLSTYVNTGKIYLSETYYRRRFPLLTFEKEECKNARVLSPTEFNDCWVKYNENQGDFKLQLTMLQEEPYYLSDLSVVMKEKEDEESKNKMYILNTGVLSREMVYFSGIFGPKVDSLIETFDLAETYCPSEDEVIDSLFTLKAGGNTHDSEEGNA